MFSQKHMKASTVGAANGNFIAAGGASACCGGATTYSTAAPQIFCSFTIMLSATQHGMTLPSLLGRAGTQACRHALLRPYMTVRPIAFDKPIVTLFSRALAHHSSRNDDVVRFFSLSHLERSAQCSHVIRRNGGSRYDQRQQRNTLRWQT